MKFVNLRLLATLAIIIVFTGGIYMDEELLAQQKQDKDIRVIIADLPFEEVWKKISINLTKFQSIKLTLDKKKGLIESEEIIIPVSGIISINYKEEKQQFRIQVKEEKPLIVTVIVTVNIWRKNYRDEWIKITDTEYYQQMIYDTIMSFERVTPPPPKK